MLFLAIRHLMSRPKQTVLVLLGISLGTMMFLIISGVQIGMQDFIMAQLLNNMPHVLIRAHDETIDAREMSERFFGDRVVRWIVPPSGKRNEEHIEYPQGWFDRLAADPRVLGYSRGVTLDAIVTRGVLKAPVMVFGVDSDEFVRLTRMESYMKEGSMRDLSAGGGRVILGSKIMEKLGTRPGETIQLSVGQGVMMPFKVAGYFKMGIREVDERHAYVSLQDAQRLNRSPGRIGTISVFIADPENAPALAAEWKSISRDRVESWEEVSGNFTQVFTIQKFTRGIITLAILVVAAFGTYNVLSILVTQKRREIAILRSIGYPPRDILNLFLIQGMILGISGAIVGIILGYLSSVWISRIDLGFDTGLGNRLNVSFDPATYVYGLGLALVSALLASYLPARAASRLTPLDIIRTEA